MPQIHIISTATTSFSDPGDWATPNSVECMGAGGGMANSGGGNWGAGGCGGGAYAVGTNLSPSFPVTIVLPASSRNSSVTPTTQFGSFVTAQGGQGGSQTSGQAGGSSFFPSGYRGGNGANPSGASGGGGGGAGGPKGTGNNGSITLGGWGNGGSTNGGAANTNGNSAASGSSYSTGWDVGSGGGGTTATQANYRARAGGSYGGGVGGWPGNLSGWGMAAAADGGPALIVIVYSAITPGSEWVVPGTNLTIGRTDGPYAVGFRFKTSHEGSVTKMSMRVGTSGIHIVFSLWSNSGTRLWTDEVFGNNWVDAELNFRLEPETYYWASWWAASGQTGFQWHEGSPTATSGTLGPISWSSPGYDYGNVRPASGNGTNWYGPNITFEVEPETRWWMFPERPGGGTDYNDDQYTVGFQFHSTRAGRITAVDVFSPHNQHIVVSLWNMQEQKTRVGSATGTGWVKIECNTPIEANTEYILTWSSDTFGYLSYREWYDNFPYPRTVGPVTMTRARYWYGFDSWPLGEYTSWWGLNMLFTVEPEAVPAQTAIIG
jgi:hypothetical protein